MNVIMCRGKACSDCGLNANDWILGYYCKDFWAPHSKGHGIIPINSERGGYVEVVPETVSCFIGIYDNTKWDELTEKEQKYWSTDLPQEEWKGKPIFKDDIVTFTRYNALGYTTNRVGYVAYDPDCAALYIMSTTGDAWSFPEVKINTIKVIGNVHDNPELISNKELFDDNEF